MIDDGKPFSRRFSLLVRLFTPCSDAKPPQIEYKDMHFLTKKQIDQVLELAKDTEYYPLFHTAIYTGMRRNEMLALRWKDIDLERKRISITKSLYLGKNSTLIDQYPKTKNSARSLQDQQHYGYLLPCDAKPSNRGC